jgi:hypothetical protein
MVDCEVARALVILPEAVALRDNRRQKDRALQVLPVLPRNGPVRQRSLSADLTFGYFVSKTK